MRVLIKGNLNQIKDACRIIGARTPGRGAAAKVRGNFVIEYRGTETVREFYTESEAEKWAVWNYKGRQGWRIVPARTRNEIAATRAVVRAAFDKVRHDPDQKHLADHLAGVLSGRLPLSEEIVRMARSVVR